jgi:hypothetical protein
MITRAFHEVTSREKQLVEIDPRSGVSAALAIIGRGSLSIADFMANATSVHKSTRMVPWNSDGLKVLSRTLSMVLTVLHVRAHRSEFVLSARKMVLMHF